MIKIIRYFLRCCAGAALILGASAFCPPAERPARAAPFQAGYTVIDYAPEDGGGAVSVGVWYPSETPETVGWYAPAGDVSLAREGAPAAGARRPVVLMSHGYTGRFRNHHTTAAALARAGYIAAAVQHRGDSDSRKNLLRRLRSRVRELHLAVRALRGHAGLSAAADFGRIGAAGYSLGGASVLHAAGVPPDLEALKEHCRLRGAEDAEFCGAAAPFLARLRRIISGFFGGGGAAPAAPAASEAPVKFQALALIAPAGKIFAPEALAAFSGPPVWIGRLGRDEILRYPFHAAYLAANLGAPAETEVFPQAPHYAFITPFAERITDKEHIPVAIDPPGFDRPAFHRKINARLLAFFLKTMPP